MPTFSVYMSALAGCTIEVEASAEATTDEIFELACEQAVLSECTAADWDGYYEISQNGVVMMTSDDDPENEVIQASRQSLRDALQLALSPDEYKILAPKIEYEMFGSRVDA